MYDCIVKNFIMHKITFRKNILKTYLLARKKKKVDQAAGYRNM